MGLAAFNRMRRLAAEQKAAESTNNAADELQQLREKAKQLGIPNASKLGLKKLRESIEAKETELKKPEDETLKEEQENQLQELRAKAIELGIEGAEVMGAEALATAIQTLEAGNVDD